MLDLYESFIKEINNKLGENKQLQCFPFDKENAAIFIHFIGKYKTYALSSIEVNCCVLISWCGVCDYVIVRVQKTNVCCTENDMANNETPSQAQV